MRVVVDTNVFVSGAINTGAPHSIVQTWLQSAAFEAVICPRLLTEITTVLLDRPNMRRWIDLDAANRYVGAVRERAVLVADPGEVSPLTRDRADDYLIALAREHGADLIVSGDKDLLEWSEQTPPVIAPAAFLEMLETSILPDAGLSP